MMDLTVDFELLEKLAEKKFPQTAYDKRFRRKPITKACEAAGLSRLAWYRWTTKDEKSRVQPNLRSLKKLLNVLQ